LVLGIDVGTSSTKAVLADVEGRFLASASSSYDYATPQPGHAEQNPEDWWQAVRAVVGELLSSYPRARSRLQAVGVSGQGVAAVLLDRHRQPLRNAILWVDTRSSAHSAGLDRTHGERLAAISGKKPAPYNVEPKLLWIRENEPEVWEQVWKVTTTTGYITLRLAGKAIMNHSDAGILLAYDLKNRVWSEEAMAGMNLPPHIFCDLASCHQIIGRITAEAANETGLPPGLPVIAGGEDTSSAGLAMGVVSEDQIQLSMGTAMTVYAPVREPRGVPNLLAFPHVLEGLTLLGGSMVAGGIAIDWLLKTLGAQTANAQNVLRQQLTAQAASIDAGSEGLIFLPYLAGELQPINDGFARGVFFGLELRTSNAHLFRSVIEGTAFAIAHNIKLTRGANATASRIRAVGGPTRNDLWCQVIADVTGTAVDAMQEQGGAALGDAILAGLGAGLFTDPLEMQQAHAKLRATFLPRSGMHGEYQRLFSIYLELYPRLHDLFPKLSAAKPLREVTENVSV
jgi:xylulokinase